MPKATARPYFWPKIAQPQLWSPVTPALYKAEVEVSSAGATVDRSITSFGIREIKVDAEQGLRINGNAYKLKGACLHCDNGPLGTVAVDRAEERRVALLKANGYNAIRCSHNPPSTVFLDACDRLGMLGIDESFDMWQQAKNPDDYHLDFKDWWRVDIDAMVLRDRNHPSVIMWSIGNEISERSDPDGVSIARDLSSRVRALDTSRPITMAVAFFFDASKPRFSRSGEAIPRLLPLVFKNAAVNMAFWMRVVAREVRAFDGLRPFTHFRAATRFRLSHAVLGVSVRRPVRKNILVSLRRYPYEQT